MRPIIRAIKPYLQGSLRRAGLYERLRASPVYDVYWRLADRTVVDARAAEVRFYRALLRGLRPGDLIVDVGANHGYKTDIFLRLGARVVAVEPDEANRRVLEQKFLTYRRHAKPVVVVDRAVSDRRAVATMWIHEPGSAVNTLSRKWVDTLHGDRHRLGYAVAFGEQRDVETVTLEDLIAEHGLPFFVKIDVEGHELHVLRGLERAVPYLSFEVNLPEFRRDGIACVERLAAVAAHGTFNYATDCEAGLALDRWLPPREFADALEGERSRRSIEVFWKTLA